MQHGVTVEIDAPTEKVWEVLADVAAWPSWTESMSSVEPLDEGLLAVGSRARLKQPLLAPAIWTVTELEPGRSFTWSSKVAGVTTVASHVVEPVDTAASRVSLHLSQTGALAGLFGLLFGRMGKRYMQTEADGLKRYCETRPIE